MKKYIFICISLVVAIAACQNKQQSTTSTTATTSNIQLPYTATYAIDFNNNVSDSDLLVVLNSYKDWETGDVNALRSTMGDSVTVNGANGFKFSGLTDSLMNDWKTMRDSLSSVKITMDVWLKNHSVKDGHDFINVWYKEIDTFKTGKVDSANYEDDNGVKDGKIVWYSSHRQQLK
ncbi:MAG TPA: hypothetical protein VIJ95_09285 [Hanamia sp.]